jgi:hypothetical protein
MRKNGTRQLNFRLKSFGQGQIAQIWTLDSLGSIQTEGLDRGWLGKFPHPIQKEPLNWNLDMGGYAS